VGAWGPHPPVARIRSPIARIRSPNFQNYTHVVILWPAVCLMVPRAHEEMESVLYGKARANLSMRVLRALFNFAAANYEVGGIAVRARRPQLRVTT
jgi:hypothetical protein